MKVLYNVEKMKEAGDTAVKCDWTDEMKFIIIQILTDKPSDADIGYVYCAIWVEKHVYWIR